MPHSRVNTLAFAVFLSASMMPIAAQAQATHHKSSAHAKKVATHEARTDDSIKDHIEHLQKPVDWQLQGTSSWINLVSGRDGIAPKGWEPYAGS